MIIGKSGRFIQKTKPLKLLLIIVRSGKRCRGVLDGGLSREWHRMSPSEEINHGLGTGKLIANRAAPPRNHVLAGGIVTNANRVDAQSAAGRNRAGEVVALGDDDQLGEIEGLLGPYA